ncbi:Uncharacterised protein [uncultured archaeon]|nr:Uncharacterised protein [uncultured archaeon]
MRFKDLFGLSLVLVALCASNAQSIGDSIGKSVDQLIDESNGIYSRDPNFPETPRESRMLWSKERGINFTMPSKLSGNSTNPEDSKMSAQTNERIQYQTASITKKAQTSSSQAIAGSQAISVVGNWTFGLRDSKSRVLALTLFQSDNAVSGTGTINDGGDTQEVAAAGSIQGDKLSLNATSSGYVNLYQLVLTINGNLASGEYRAFPISGEPWIGLAEGMRATSD